MSERREMPIAVTVMNWYHEKDYASLLDLFVDADKLPATYADWLSRAQNGERIMTAQGKKIVRGYIEPEPFAEWCAANGRPTNATSRGEYATARWRDAQRGA